MSRFVWSGEEPYESVQQHNKGTLDRFKKMIKTGPKVSIYSHCCKSNYYDLLRRWGVGGGGRVPVLEKMGCALEIQN